MKKSASTLPPEKMTPAERLIAQSKFERAKVEFMGSPESWRAEMEPPALRPNYRIHWRTEITPAHIELIGHIDYHAPTPEAAVEKFQNDFPGREITRAVAL